MSDTNNLFERFCNSRKRSGALQSNKRFYTHIGNFQSQHNSPSLLENNVAVMLNGTNGQNMII